MRGRLAGWEKGSPPQYARLIRERKGNKALRLLARKTNGTAAAVIPEGPTSLLYVYIRVYIYQPRPIIESFHRKHDVSVSSPTFLFCFIFSLYRSLSLAVRQIPPAATDSIVFSLLNRLGRFTRGRSKHNICYYINTISLRGRYGEPPNNVIIYRVLTAQM